MVVKRRLLLAITAVLAVALSGAVPVLGAFGPSQPDPLVQDDLIRVQDVAVVTKTAGVGPVVAVGWRQAAKPGELFVAFSTDGGRSFLKQNGTMRQFRVAGEGTRGLSLDICGGRIWVGTVVNYPGDDPDDKDVLLTSRTMGGQAGQAFLTDAAGNRTARQVSVACVGNRLLAVAWVETSFGKQRAKLMIRSLEPLGEPTSVRQVFGLGAALPQNGIAVDAGTDSVHVAWTAGQKENVLYEAFLIGDGPAPSITRGGDVRLAGGDALLPQVATRGQKVVVVYTDAGKVKARVSGDTGTTFGEPSLVVGTGSRQEPSEAHSVDVSGPRIVVEATASAAGAKVPQRISSNDSGVTWAARDFGHVGARVGALRKTSAESSLLVEAWQNNDPGIDTLRAQFERP
jgi:hypothetical protein